jgi:hypothetical protein
MTDSEDAFQEARAAWRAALRDHVLAPPDAGFSARLAQPRRRGVATRYGVRARSGYLGDAGRTPAERGEQRPRRSVGCRGPGGRAGDEEQGSGRTMRQSRVWRRLGHSSGGLAERCRRGGSVEHSRNLTLVLTALSRSAGRAQRVSTIFPRSPPRFRRVYASRK